MGSPAVIKVDTEQLRAMASGYTIRSNSVDVAKNNNSGTIQTIVYRMPAYDGRLQQAVRGDVLDFNKRADEFSNWFKADSASLIKTAEAFEVIDGQTIQVFQQADDGLSRWSLIDSGIDLGLSTKVTSKTIPSPDDVLPKTTTTITVVRTINADDTVTTTTTITTVIVVDEKTAADWNTAQKVGEAIFIGGVFIFAGWELSTLAAELELSALAAKALGAGLRVVGTGVTIEGILNPERGWKARDTITSTSTIVTTEPLLSPDTPLPETPVLGPDITTTKVVRDSQDHILSQDTTGVDSAGNLK
jgi:hypothetical protein